ncbi:MAG: GDP-L-fucose synthase [Phycisphaerae bacterium]|jgi:GDP-L-fucose synthase
MWSPLADKRVCVTGGAGFLGRSVCERLMERGVASLFVPRSSRFDLTRPDDVARMLDAAAADIVIHLAAQVGGIGANKKQPGRFFYANMAMGLHLIEESRRRNIEKFVQVGTVCAYPKHCETPFREDDLWSGFPEETNAPYGVAKRALGLMIESYRAQYGFNGIYVIPVNLYGPGDNFDVETSHVIPALVRKFCAAVDSGATTVTCWGSGQVSREFLYVDDAADAIVRAAGIHNDSAPINLGTGREIRISELADLIAGLCGYQDKIVWDTSQPDGQPRRRLDTSRAATLLDWHATVDLIEGLRRTIDWWRTRHAQESVQPTRPATDRLQSQPVIQLAEPHPVS